MPDPSGELTSYAELAEILGALPLLLREARRQRRLSIRAAALELDCSFVQALWITYAIVTRQWGFIISALAYTVAYIRLFRVAPKRPVEPREEPS